MVNLLWIPTCLLLGQAVHSYILLTANIDDLRNIGKRVVQSPIVGQVGNIVRRAYDAFNTHLNKARTQMRSDDRDIVLSYHPDDPDKESRRIRESRRYNNNQSSDRDQASNREQASNRDEASNRDRNSKGDQTGKKDQASNRDQSSNRDLNSNEVRANNGDQANNRDRASNMDQASKNDSFSSLGKSASVYLEKIKDIFEKANPGKTWNARSDEDEE